MKREAELRIEKWLNSGKYPLVVFGARQVGKTYVITNYFQNSKYDFFVFNLLNNEEIADVFENSRNVIETMKMIAFDNNIDLESSNTVIFFDEIQRSGKLYQGLKYLSIEFPNIHIICAGSLVGVWLRKISFSYPVGYVEEYTMYPLSFKEFLTVTGNERYIPLIESAFTDNKPLSDVIHNSLLEKYRLYLLLGGMPELVKNYLDNNQELINTDFSIIDKIINEYYNDMSKNVDENKDKLRVRRMYDAIVPQLEKTNPKFTYAKLDKNDRKNDYVVAFDWLLAANVVYQCNQVSTPIYLLKAYEDFDSYKIFLNDTGILCSKAGIKRGMINFDGDYQFKGVLTKNYVANELVQLGFDLLYFTKKNENNNGMEIDFVVQIGNDVIPIEVKAGDHTQSKSLKSYIGEFNPPYAIRISTKNFGIENNIKSVPLYAVFCINDN